jgi:hypothetical protein
MSEPHLTTPTACIAHATAAIRQRVGAAAGTLQCEGWEGPCENDTAVRRRQNTAYVEDERNWVTLCPECMAANDAHWKDMWDDYYAGCL